MADPLHGLEYAREAVALAGITASEMGEDVESAMLDGLLHDCDRIDDGSKTPAQWLKAINQDPEGPSAKDERLSRFEEAAVPIDALHPPAFAAGEGW